MDDSETYMNVNFTKTDAQSLSPAEPDVSYAELNVKTLSAPRVRTDRDGLNSTYSELNFRKEEPRIDEDEDPPIASGPGGLPTTAQTGPHKQESKEKIGNRSYRKICLLCLVTSILIAIVAGLSIHVSRTRQSLITSDRNYRRLWEQHQEMNRTQRQCQQQVRELNSTLASRTSENSRMDLSQRNCLKNISALNNNLSNLENNITVLNSELSELNQTHTDLHRQFNQLETMYKTISKNKVQICQYLTSRREQSCPQGWMENEDRCYFRSSVGNTYDGAREQCSKFYARLLEINSDREMDFVSSSIGYADRTYWIGKCRDGNVASNLLFKMHYRPPICSTCYSNSRSYNCKSKYGFICEKSAYLYPDIAEVIQGLCQQPVGPDLIK
ncbi:B-cell differentiation antigen CD72-like [Mobula hypostoma]|uniref:B-cell differentiation antigen CD72-like n=1 Tax=Mobula hypostoma TaxID=723540 RepID=UPI002FC312AC